MRERIITEETSETRMLRVVSCGRSVEVEVGPCGDSSHGAYVTIGDEEIPALIEALRAHMAERSDET